MRKKILTLSCQHEPVTIHQLISVFEKHGGDAPWDRAVAASLEAKKNMTEEEWRFEGGVKESVCFPFEYDGPAFAGRCECCCPPSLRSPVFRKIPVTPKPDDVHPATWYRDY